MGYSVSWRTKCGGDDNMCDDTSLLKFAAKRAKYHISRNISLAKGASEYSLEGLLNVIASPVTAPFIFLGNLAFGYLYRCPNAFIEGTPEHEEYVKRIEVIPHPSGIGVRIKYPPYE